jgi:hypothetical protein
LDAESLELTLARCTHCTTIGRLLASLAGGHADRSFDKRLSELVHPAVLNLDDFRDA